MADALVSGSSEAIHVGSSPVVRTKREYPRKFGGIFAWYGCRDLCCCQNFSVLFNFYYFSFSESIMYNFLSYHGTHQSKITQVGYVFFKYFFVLRNIWQNFVNNSIIIFFVKQYNRKFVYNAARIRIFDAFKHPFRFEA